MAQLWGTKDDQVVNQKNFYALDESLTKAKVKHQTNIYQVKIRMQNRQTCLLSHPA